VRKSLFTGLVLCAAIEVFAGIPEAEYRQRRERLAELLDTSSAVVLRAAEPRQRSNDVNYRYRQESNFFYLTGIEEPNVILLIIPRELAVAGKSVSRVLFVPPDYGDARRADLFADGIVTDAARFPELFEAALSGLRTLYVSAPDVRFVNDWLSDRRLFLDRDSRKELERRHSDLKVKNAGPMVTGLREVKSANEIALIREAIRMTGDGLRRAMETCREGAYEYELQAAVEFEMTRQGAGYQSFPSIIGSGPNSLIPHYDENRRQMKDGEVAVIDVGAEYAGYAADITRTIPVSGRFSKEQREVYTAVLKAQGAVMAAIRPGLRWAELQKAATASLAAAGFGKYLTHAVSHHVGLDVHDPGSMDTLKAGMVITVEPGAYIPVNDSVLAPGYRGFGVRIEDDVLVEKDGATVLSKDIPRDIDAVEAIVGRKK
jgi:Xaa-Pro aminopeptidase